MDNSKFTAARKALTFVKPGMTIGLGTGSTAEVFVELLGKLNKSKNLHLACVPTSIATEKQARKLGLTVVDFSKVKSLDAAFDGADQVDPKLNLIKGLGGALVREKIVDMRARNFYVMVGENKLVSRLCGIVPVEVIPIVEKAAAHELSDMGAVEVELRQSGGKKFISDNGNVILHARFGAIANPSSLESKINGLPGVVDNGIFPRKKGFAAIVGSGRGDARVIR
ncbi:MAG: ribose-5-phosphate isomerase RpiA [Candidatus Micrarchaeota archaeon]|nr:ribose-5-phosphate isomerase RpiA [Candidatus Micrarchaeota archaeon]